MKTYTWQLIWSVPPPPPHLGCRSIHGSGSQCGHRMDAYGNRGPIVCSFYANLAQGSLIVNYIAKGNTQSWIRSVSVSLTSLGTDYYAYIWPESMSNLHLCIYVFPTDLFPHKVLCALEAEADSILSVNMATSSGHLGDCIQPGLGRYQNITSCQSGSVRASKASLQKSTMDIWKLF